MKIVTDQQQPRIPSIHLSTHPLTGHSLHTLTTHWPARSRLNIPLFFDLFVGHLIEHVQISIPPSSWYLGLLMDSNMLTHYPGYPFTCAWTCASIHCSPLLATIHSGQLLLKLSLSWEAATATRVKHPDLLRLSVHLLDFSLFCKCTPFPSLLLTGKFDHCTMCTLCSLSSFQPNKLKHNLKSMSWYPI